MAYLENDRISSGSQQCLSWTSHKMTSSKKCHCFKDKAPKQLFRHTHQIHRPATPAIRALRYKSPHFRTYSQIGQLYLRGRSRRTQIGLTRAIRLTHLLLVQPAIWATDNPVSISQGLHFREWTLSKVITAPGRLSVAPPLKARRVLSNPTIQPMAAGLPRLRVTRVHHPEVLQPAKTPAKAITPPQPARPLLRFRHRTANLRPKSSPSMP